MLYASQQGCVQSVMAEGVISTRFKFQRSWNVSVPVCKHECTCLYIMPLMLIDGCRLLHELQLWQLWWRKFYLVKVLSGPFVSLSCHIKADGLCWMNTHTLVDTRGPLSWIGGAWHSPHSNLLKNDFFNNLYVLPQWHTEYIASVFRWHTRDQLMNHSCCKQPATAPLIVLQQLQEQQHPPSLRSFVIHV